MADTVDRGDAAEVRATAAGPDAAIASKPFLYRVTRRFYRLPNRRRTLLLQAVLRLALARLALVFVPFRKLAGRFGTVTPPAKAPDAPMR